MKKATLIVFLSLSLGVLDDQGHLLQSLAAHCSAVPSEVSCARINISCNELV